MAHISHSSLRRRDRPLLRLGFDSVGALIYQADWRKRWTAIGRLLLWSDETGKKPTWQRWTTTMCIVTIGWGTLAALRTDRPLVQTFISESIAAPVSRVALTSPKQTPSFLDSQFWRYLLSKSFHQHRQIRTLLSNYSILLVPPSETSTSAQDGQHRQRRQEFTPGRHSQPSR